MSAGRSMHLWRISRSLLRLRATPAAVSAAGSCVRAPPPPYLPLAAVSPAYAPITTSSWHCRPEQNETDTSKEDYFPDPSLDSSDSDLSEVQRTQILEEALKLVPEYGWSGAVLSEGAKAVGLSGVMEEEEVFPRGPSELVDYFEQQCNQSLNEIMEKLSTEDKLDGSKMIRAAVEQRLRMLIPYIEKWPQAMAVKALPPNIPSSLETLALMVDDIWYMAGDKSTDINWYTKRALLGSLYTSTELYMVQDKSHDFLDTWDFLETRINDIKDVSKIYDDLGGVAKGAVEFITAGITTARNMAGWNKKQE